MKLRCRIPLANFELNIDVTFDTRVTAIFGPSGSGKTTLLDAIAGLRAIADGEIEIDGRALFSSARGINLPPQQRGVGYVPQEGALFPHLSVRKNILFGAERGYATQSTTSNGSCVELLEIAICWTGPSPSFRAAKRKGCIGPRDSFAAGIASARRTAGRSRYRP